MRPLFSIIVLVLSVSYALASYGTAPGDCRGTSPHFATSIDMLETLYKYYNAGDLEGLLSHFDEDGEITWPSPVMAPFSGT